MDAFPPLCFRRAQEVDTLPSHWRLVRQHLAQPGVTITESKFLRDAVLDVDREVDIVIEGELDGEPIVISMEVNERSRKATLPRVQEQIEKHRHLPTNRLILVSKAGFTETALVAAANEGSKVETITPEVATVDGEPIVKRFYVDFIHTNPTGCRMHVLFDSELIAFPGSADLNVFSEDGDLLGVLAQLVQEAVLLQAVQVRFSFDAHFHPDREHLTSFTLGIPIHRLGYHLLREETTELHLIARLDIWGDFKFVQTEVPLTVSRLGRHAYGAAEAVEFFGRRTVWVGTTNQAKKKTTISWQSTDHQTSPAPMQSQPTRFPALLTLFEGPLSLLAENRQGDEMIETGVNAPSGEG